MSKFRLMLDPVTPRLWFIPIDPNKGAFWAEGDCAFTDFLTDEERAAFVDGYRQGWDAARTSAQRGAA